jgi:hypothetical protein
MKLHIRKHLISFSISAALLGSLPVHAMAVTETVETAPFIPAVGSSFHPLAKDISMMMGHIAIARNSLQQQAPGTAKTELEQSQSIIKNLEKHYGSRTLSLLISATHKTLNADTRDAYHESNMRSFQLLDTAKDELRQGQLASAEHIVDKIEYPLVYAEIDIPLRQLQDGVTKALSLINQGKSAAADQALKQTQFAAQTDANLFGGDFRA